MRRLAPLAVLLALALPAVARAETVTVNKVEDENDGECVVDCTLREALITSSPEATIVVPGGTYTAETASFALNGNRTIQGAGAGATRLSAPGRRVLLVGPGTSMVTGVRIGDGSAAGAGGGIHVGSGASFTLRDSVVDHNTAPLGGGIYSEGALTVERSLVQANDAEATPASGSRGGGIAVNGGTATITDTTLSDNGSDAFGGGLHVQAGNATLRNVTLAGNSGTQGSALNQEGAGAITAANTLVADTGGVACRLTPAGVQWTASVVEGDTTCGDVPVVADARLSFLDGNGGPTDTHALELGSPAIDTGAAPCPAVDQRGVARPQGAACDIGAYERVIQPVPVNTFADGDDGECVDDCTLREALADVTAHVIHVPSGTYTLSPQLGQLLVMRTVAIQGTGATLPAISPDLQLRHRVFHVQNGATLRLSRVRVANGFALDDSGGGILVDSDSALELSDSEVADSEAVWGGGIWADGDLSVRNSLIVGNDAIAGGEGLGGGIGLGDGDAAATIVNTTVSGNASDGWGGGLFTQRSTALQNVSIVGNTAPPRGAGETTGRGGGLSQDFAGDPAAVTTARNVLVADNVNGGCGGTVNDPIDSANGLIDEPLPFTTCNAVGAGNLIVPDAGLGGLADNGGPTRTHALLAGSPAINAGADCPADDQRGVARPQGPACDIGAYEAPAPQPPQAGGGDQPPPPPPDDDQELPPPTAGEEVNAAVARGTVKVRLPGSKRFVELSDPRQLPVGTVVDTLKGRVTLVAAGGQEATFYAGIFKIGQGKGSRPLTTLTLVEKLGCAKAGKAVAAAKGKKKRRLWGDGSGRFRTKGKHSAATVVGTKWLVEDRCTSTLTRVARGRVSVRDFVKKKTVLVRAGKKYVARARR